MTATTEWLFASGEMAERIRSFPWGATRLGPPEGWAQALRVCTNLMLEAHHPGYIAWGADLTSLYNDAYIPILGDKHPDSLGQPYRELWAEIWEQFSPIVDATLQGQAQHFLDRPLPLAGRRGRAISWFTFSWTPLRDDAGVVSGFYCVAVESTERKEAEHRADESRKHYVRGMDAATEAIWDWDLSSRSIRQNRRGIELLGLDPSADSYPQDIIVDYVPADDLPALQAALTSALAGDGRYHHEHRLRTAGGDFIWVLARGEVVERSARGKPLRMVGSWMDITSLKLGEQALMHTNLMLEEERNRVQLLNLQLQERAAEAEGALRAKRAFLRNVSHELRTPLNHIRGGIDVLRMEPHTALQDPWLNIVAESSRKLAALVERLLDVTQAAAGGGDPVEFELAGLLEQARAGISSSAAAKGLDVSVDVDPRLSTTLLGKPHVLLEALVQYLDNAVKFTPRGSIRLSAQALCENETGVLVRVEVRDTGVGVAQENQGSLFAPLEQEDTAITRSQGGLGTGLAHARQLARVIGGETGFESTPGRGSAFWITARFRKAARGTARALAVSSDHGSGR